jgi:hypothetical protein
MRLQVAAIVLLILVPLLGAVCPRLALPPAEAGLAGAQRSQRSTPGRTETSRPAPARSDYSKFSHHVPQHRQACDTCHKFPTANWQAVRKGDEAFPDVTDYPGHASCLGCHRQQFFSGARPAICSVCHTNPSPRDSARHPFASVGETYDLSAKGKGTASQFAVDFPHDKHKDLFENCAVCHQTYQPQGQ